MSIHHLQIWVPDLARAERSWGWLLGEIGYELARQWDTGRVWRCGDVGGNGMGGVGIVIEESPDMVPGMLYSRLRPGLNHLALKVDEPDHLNAIVGAAANYGWHTLDNGGLHPIPGGLSAAYLEDADGFEIELLTGTATDQGADEDQDA